MGLFDLLRGGRPEKRTHTRPREVVLGLDWGTSATKMVLRDYSDLAKDSLGRAYVVEHPGDAFRKDRTRYPSTIVVHDGRIWLGPEADRRWKDAAPERRWRSLKMVLRDKLFGEAYQRPVNGLDGISLWDLATASIAHVIAIGDHHAQRLAKRSGQAATVEVILGIPSTKRSDRRGERYAETVRRALALRVLLGNPGGDGYVLGQGVRLGDLRALLRRVDADLTQQPKIETPGDYVRRELAAALFWPYRNPTTQEGLYAAIDIGAGTTNQCFYRLSALATGQGWVRRGQIAFYAGRCDPPGCDALDEALANALGKPDPTALRGHEDRYLERVPEAQHAFDDVVKSMKEQWKRTKGDAWNKERGNSRWDNLNILVLGGGSQIRRLRQAFHYNPIPNAHGIVPIDDLPPPDDLFHLPAGPTGKLAAYSGRHELIYVAYGLAVRPGDFAKIYPSDEVEPFNPAPRNVLQLTPEALGYADK